MSTRRNTTTVSDPAVAWAEKLWAKLRTGLLNTEKTIAEIIHDKAWEPLGYDSFTEAWSAKLADITIATELRAHVVYQMLHEGSDYDDIAHAVKGVGRDAAKVLDRQRRNGVPANLATTAVRAYTRRKPDTAKVLHLHLGSMKLQRYRRIAKKLDLSVEQIALEAVESVFAKLVEK